MGITPLKNLADALRKNGLDIAAVHGNTPTAALYRAFATRLDAAIAEALAMPEEQPGITPTQPVLSGGTSPTTPTISSREQEQ